MKTIALDLRDLTAEKLEEAKPHMGKCRYHSPCIIGTLIPPDLRRMRGIKQTHNLSVQPFTFPAEQVLDAFRLQEAFDTHNWDLVTLIAKPYIAAEKNAAA